ncbi:hypothetical protein KSF_101310 [Reticulibacter mediterranei]|uniref:Pentapeptide repeat-containing protein n=1 Tax=Reticulibacter mediterranei TaxID=2778369 RepID=A0A8J3IT91_9CHLR|nr:pentapeptide repeat-containing protein [Reticulibacter mediterranei]GHP00084.1 hypothetical protein KSF_101310 [Reticulibacter mediterranei]
MLRNADLTKANLGNAVLTEADFTGADLALDQLPTLPLFQGHGSKMDLFIKRYPIH